MTRQGCSAFASATSAAPSSNVQAPHPDAGRVGIRYDLRARDLDATRGVPQPDGAVVAARGEAAVGQRGHPVGVVLQARRLGAIAMTLQARGFGTAAWSHSRPDR